MISHYAHNTQISRKKCTVDSWSLGPGLKLSQPSAEGKAIAARIKLAYAGVAAAFYEKNL